MIMVNAENIHAVPVAPAFKIRINLKANEDKAEKYAEMFPQTPGALALMKSRKRTDEFITKTQLPYNMTVNDITENIEKLKKIKETVLNESKNCKKEFLTRGDIPSEQTNFFDKFIINYTMKIDCSIDCLKKMKKELKTWDYNPIE